MSGGHFDYVDGRLCDEIFGLFVDYDIGGKRQSEQAKKARKENRLKDEDISELVYDTLCLVHSYDCWQSDDTDESQYRKDVEMFKNKWLLPRLIAESDIEEKKMIKEMWETHRWKASLP